MNFELISSDEFDGLPEDNEQCFVEFESICRRNMTRMINADTSQGFDRSVQAQYAAAVSSVAVECGLPLATNPLMQDDNNFYEEFSRFSLAVQGEVARIRIRNRRSRGSLSVQLLENTRTKIHHYISRLRDAIEASNLPEDRKAALRSKLDEFVKEMEQRRLNLGKAMLVLCTILTVTANTTTIAKDGHEAITHIMRLIGVDKQSEEQAQSRLAPPPRALPAPPQKHAPAVKKTASRWQPTERGDLDDDIPF